MKKIIWQNGLISGSLNAIMMLYMGLKDHSNPDFEFGVIKGFAAMTVAMSFIFVGVYQASKLNSEMPFSFKRAYLTALWITLISSLMYAISWMLVNKFIYPEFMTDYTNAQMKHMQETGAKAEELSRYKQEAIDSIEMMKNPFILFLVTLSEILPFGLLLSLIAAAIFKKKAVSL